MKYTTAERAELDRLDAIRAAYAVKVGHTCPSYVTARSWAPHWDGPSDPALQDGIGCAICFPPDGRVSRTGLAATREDDDVVSWGRPVHPRISDAEAALRRRGE